MYVIVPMNVYIFNWYDKPDELPKRKPQRVIAPTEKRFNFGLNHSYILSIQLSENTAF